MLQDRVVIVIRIRTAFLILDFVLVDVIKLIARTLLVIVIRRGVWPVLIYAKEPFGLGLGARVLFQNANARVRILYALTVRVGSCSHTAVFFSDEWGTIFEYALLL